MRILPSIICLLTNLFLTNPAAGQTMALTSLDWPPYTGADLADDGASAKVVREALTAAGMDLQVRFFPWQRAVQTVREDGNFIGYFPEYHAESIEADYSKGCITGVVKFEDRIIMLLDMESIVADLNPELGLRTSGKGQPMQRNPAGPVRILFADDSSMIRKSLSRGLEQAGFEVTAASDGKVAWDQLLSLKGQAQVSGRPIFDLVNLVISDIEMPTMDGHNLTKRIKADPVLKELPVILFSSLISDALRHKGESVGANDQIAKPDIASLNQRVKSLLHERQGIVFD